MDFDFTGFTFGDYHSDSEGLNIVRVSDGDRYSENLFPEVKDLTAEVPGMDGEYYFGSTYGTKTFEINFAFDSLTEEQFRQLRRAFGTKNLKQLIFDERPYKKYIAKIESPIELSFVCFDEPKRTVGSPRDGVRRKGDGWEQVTPWVYEEGTQRIYKGDGTISLVCYYPFAKSVYKVLPYAFELTKDTEIKPGKVYFVKEEAPEVRYVPVDNLDVEHIDTYYEKVTNEECKDWAISSGMKSANDYDYSKIDKYNNGNFKVYNPGDLETGFRLYCPFKVNNVRIDYANLSLVYSLNNKIVGQLYFNSDTIEPIGEDEGFLIDTNSHLVIGVIQSGIDVSGNPLYTTTGNLYNQYIDGGRFFKLDPSTDIGEIQVTNGNEHMELFYDYIYF